MFWADWVMRAFALFGVIVFTYQVGKHGLQWVMNEVTGWFSVAKAEFIALEARVKNLENGAVIPIPGTPAANKNIPAAYDPLKAA